MKQCTQCGATKSLDKFEKNRNKCRECRKHTPEYNRNWKYKKKYGISLDEYNEILASQNNECCICGTNDPGGPGSTFTVDHNHKTEEVRGLLCSNCNRGLGFFKDNPDHLFAATKYLIERGYYG